MSGVGLVAVAFCGGYTVRFGPKDPFAICSLPYGALAYRTHEGPLTPFGGFGRRECFCSEEGRGKRTDCTSGYA